jgi:hypothetical protein
LQAGLFFAAYLFGIPVKEVSFFKLGKAPPGTGTPSRLMEVLVYRLVQREVVCVSPCKIKCKSKTESNKSDNQEIRYFGREYATKE